VTRPSLDDFLSRLDGVKPDGSGRWKALCKSHDDHNPSLSITEGDDGKILLKCQAGCETSDALAAYGMTMADLFLDENKRSNGNGKLGELVAAYDYVDENGTLLYENCRFVPKDFRARRPDGNGGWIWDVKGCERVLYGLPELLVARTAGEPILLVEGEKDVHTARGLGLVATTAPFGASQPWLPEFSESLRGADVIVIPDNDDVGREHMAKAAAALQGIAKSVTWLELPGLADKGDVSDWVAAGGDADQLARLVVDAQRDGKTSVPLTDEDDIRSAFIAAPDLAASESVETAWILADYIAAAATTQLTGQPKAGKSLLAMCLANAVASGHEFMGRQTKQGIVVYLSEQTAATFKTSARATGLLANANVIVLLRSRVWKHDWPTIITEAIAYCCAVGAVLLIIDTVGRWASLAGDSENDSGSALAVMQPLEEAAAAGLAVLAIRHERKSPGSDVVDAGRGSSAFAGAFDQLLSLKKVGCHGHDNRRRLLAEGRFDETPHELVIDYAHGVYVDRGSGLDVESNEVSAAVLALLPDNAGEAWTLDELLAACNEERETTKPTLVRVLGNEKGHGLVGTGRIRRKKGVGSASARAYGYWREVEP
jgi:hypothetical protein